MSGFVVQAHICIIRTKLGLFHIFDQNHTNNLVSHPSILHLSLTHKHRSAHSSSHLCWVRVPAVLFV